MSFTDEEFMLSCLLDDHLLWDDFNYFCGLLDFEAATNMKGRRYLIVIDDGDWGLETDQGRLGEMRDLEAANIEGFHLRDFPSTFQGLKRENRIRVKTLESEGGMKPPPMTALRSKPRWSVAGNEWVSPVIVAVTSFAAGFVPLLRGGEIGRVSFQVFMVCLMVAHSSASSAMFLRHKKPKAAGLLKFAAAISMASAVALFLPIAFRRTYEGV